MEMIAQEEQGVGRLMWPAKKKRRKQAEGSMWAFVTPGTTAHYSLAIDAI